MQDDDVCPKCGATVTVGEWPFCPHGFGGRYSCIPDDYGRDITVENMGHTPVTYRTRSERKRLMAERGVTEFVRHVGKQGSDKNEGVTDRWV